MENKTDLPERLKQDEKLAKPKKLPKVPKQAKEPKPPAQKKEKMPNAPAEPTDPNHMFKHGFLDTVYKEKPAKHVVTRFPPEPNVRVIYSKNLIHRVANKSGIPSHRP